MKIAFLYSIIFMLTTTTLQIWGMEATQQLLLSNQHHYQALSKKNYSYKNQILPDEVFDKIIAYCPHDDRQTVKEVCTQLAYLTSIHRLAQFVMHDFVIGDKKEKSAFFKTLIKTNNPDLITTIVAHANKEFEFTSHQCIPDAVCISLNPEEEELQKKQKAKEYIQKEYLNPLLQEALKQNNEIMLERLKTEENNDTIEAHKNFINKIWGKRCISSSLIVLLLGVCGVTGYVLARPPSHGCYPNTTICW